MTEKPPAARSVNARMYVLVPANAKDAFLRSSSPPSLPLLLLLFNIVQETLFPNHDIRDLSLFYGTTLLKFDSL
jgi:hypothetical protein